MKRRSVRFRLSDYVSKCTAEDRERLVPAVSAAMAADDPVPALVSAYRNADTATRTVLSWVFHAAGDRRAAGPLIRDLACVTSPASLRAAAAGALGWIGGRGVYAALARALRDDPDETVRTAAASSLGWLGDRRALPQLLAAMDDTAEARTVRAQAAEALGVLGERGAVPALIIALSSDIAEVRYWAAYALGQLHDRRAIPALRSLAASDQAIIPGWVAVADEAADAIRRIEEWPDPAR